MAEPTAGWAAGGPVAGLDYPADLAELRAQQNIPEIPLAAVGGSVLLGTHLPGSVLDAHITALADGYHIPADIARHLPLRGSPAAVAEQLQSYADVGAQHIVLSLIGDDWRQQCNLLAQAARLD